VDEVNDLHCNLAAGPLFSWLPAVLHILEDFSATPHKQRGLFVYTHII